jgi:hypothetical protein
MAVQYCARCKRRHVAMYHVPDEVKKLVLLGRWKSGVCIACFDELAQRGGIAYSFEDVTATSWSDQPDARKGTRPR